MDSALFEQIPGILSATEDRTLKAKRTADLLRATGKYRWVGLYEVLRKRFPSSRAASSDLAGHRGGRGAVYYA